MNEFKERYEMMNQMYALIYPILMNYESKGFNAHSRTQTIVAEAIEKCDEWIRRQKIGLKE